MSGKMTNMIGLTGFSLPIADNTCAHSLGYRPVQDIQGGKLETDSKIHTDARNHPLLLGGVEEGV